MVPKGTSIIISSPLIPDFLEPPPSPPFPALKCFLNLKLWRVQRLAFPFIIIFPPSPPSPPSGPPLGIYFSLLKCVDPLPPFPELTLSFT